MRSQGGANWPPRVFVGSVRPSLTAPDPGVNVNVFGCALQNPEALMRSSSLRFYLAAYLVTGPSVVGCRSPAASAANAPAPSGGLAITAEQIARSGARNAGEVLKREAPMLALRENRKGQAAGIGRHGPSSIYLNDGLLVIVDGARVSDFQVLQSIPADAILSISVLTGIEATTYYGTNSVSGVVEIHTKNGSES